MISAKKQIETHFINHNTRQYGENKGRMSELNLGTLVSMETDVDNLSKPVLRAHKCPETLFGNKV